MNIFFLILVSVCHSVAVYTMDIDLSYANDKPFLLWCGALTCKQTKSEDTPIAKPREFLGIDESSLPKGVFYIPHAVYEQHIIASGEKIITDTETGMRDRRLAGRWRRLDDGKPDDYSIHKKLNEDDFKHSLDGYGRYYTAALITHSCYDQNTCDDDEQEDLGQPVKLRANSLPYAGSYYLYPGICAHKDENIWIKCDPATMALSDFLDNSADSFPLYIMWVEQFKKPRIVTQFMLPAKSYYIAEGSVAVKFVNNDTEFQIYYDCSDKKKVLTYTLDRVRSCVHAITPVLMRQWYGAFNKFKEGTLSDDTLTQVKQSMLDTVHAVENIKNS